MNLPATIDEDFEAALAIDESRASGMSQPQLLTSYLKLDENNALPRIPMASQQAYQGQMRNLLYHYMTQPNFGNRDLTEEEKEAVTPFEVGLWNFCKKFRDENTDFTERKWLMEMMAGPVVNRNENVNVNVTQDWRKDLQVKATEVADTMAFAKALEAESAVDADEIFT